MKWYLFVFALLVLNFFEVCVNANAPEKVTEILKGKMAPGNFRYKTFAKAFHLMEKRGVKTIVETGTTRGVNLEDIFSGDGGSTLLFAEWASLHGAHIYTVDIEPLAFVNAAPLLAQYQEYYTPICSDSVAFLETFPDTIDFLYLDSYDYDVNDPYPSQAHHLKEITTVYSKLTEDSIVLIDDCNLPHGGKGKLAIEYLIRQGWKILIQDYQVLLIKK